VLAFRVDIVKNDFKRNFKYLFIGVNVLRGLRAILEKKKKAKILKKSN